MNKLDVVLHELYGASTVAESMDSANPGLCGGETFAFDGRPVNSEIPDPTGKFLANEELRKALGEIPAVEDARWDDPIAPSVSHAAPRVAKTLGEKLGVVSTRVEKRGDQLFNVGFDKNGEEVASLLIRE